MKKLNVQQMENVSGGWVVDALACAGGITAVAVLFKPATVTAAALSIGRAFAWSSAYLSNKVNIGIGCGSLLASL